MLIFDNMGHMASRSSELKTLTKNSVFLLRTRGVCTVTQPFSKSSGLLGFEYTRCSREDGSTYVKLDYFVFDMKTSQGNSGDNKTA